MSNGDTSGTSLSDIANFVSGLDSQAAAWYRGITGVQVVTPVTSGQLAAAQQIAIQQAQQASLLATNPTLAGILANPTAIIVIALVLIGILILAFRA